MKSFQSDDIVELAFEAIRNQPALDGPSQEVTDRTLQVANARAIRKPFLREMLMRSRHPLAALFVLAIGVVVVLLVLRTPVVACADVIKKISQARLVQFEEEMDLDPRVIRVIVSDDGIEYQMNANYRAIIDNRSYQHQVYLFPQGKRATVYIGPTPEKKPATLLDEFRGMIDKPSKDLGADSINGRAAEKFLVEHLDHMQLKAVSDPSGKIFDLQMDKAPEVFTLWADAKTGDLLRVEQVTRIGADTRKVVYKNFVVNPTLTQTELSSDIPKEYEVHFTGSSMLSPQRMEQTMIQMLRSYAQSHDGHFPLDISAFPSGVVFTGKESEMSAALMAGTTKPAANPMTGESSTDVHIGVLIVTASPTTEPADKSTNTYSQKGDIKVVPGWDYYTGRRAGDKDTIVFCFKSGDHFRGICGDFSVKDISSPPEN